MVATFIKATHGAQKLGADELQSWVAATFSHLHNGEFELGMEQLIRAQGPKPKFQLATTATGNEALRLQAIEARSRMQQIKFGMEAAQRNAVQAPSQASEDALSRAQQQLAEAQGDWEEAQRAWEKAEAADADVAVLWLVMRGCGPTLNGRIQAREQVC